MNHFPKSDALDWLLVNAVEDYDHCWYMHLIGAPARVIERIARNCMRRALRAKRSASSRTLAMAELISNANSVDPYDTDIVHAIGDRGMSKIDAMIAVHVFESAFTLDDPMDHADDNVLCSHTSTSVVWATWQRQVNL